MAGSSTTGSLVIEGVLDEDDLVEATIGSCSLRTSIVGLRRLIVASVMRVPTACFGVCRMVVLGANFTEAGLVFNLGCGGFELADGRNC